MPHGPRYLVRVRTDSELYWSAHFFCGLYQLVERGLVQVKFTARLPLAPKEIFATAFEVTDLHSGAARKVAIDWRDNPDMLCPNKLAACDVYFKRNIVPEITYDVCPAEFRPKLRPAGLSFAVRTRLERPLWVQMIGGLCSKEEPILSRSPRQTLRRLYKVRRGPVNVRHFLRVEDFEINPRDEAGIDTARNALLFQTRAYDPAESTFPQDTARVTEERAHIIRRLRAEFKDQFVGGFTRIPYAVETFPDCLADADSAQSSYARLVKSCRICIYTRGLRNSPAFKLGEYLASGRCILAERPRTLLPKPLIHGKHLLFFRTTDELVDQCRRLLQDEALQHRLSRGALDYYRDQVRPVRRVWTMLEESFAAATNRVAADSHEALAR